MADPISIAGTALGGISLGLEICQGLLSYYQSYKSCSDQLSHLYVKLDRLKSTLEKLQALLQPLNPSNKPAIDEVTNTIASCQVGMSKLRAYLDKCQVNPAPQGIKEKFQKSIRQTAFPFREKTLKGLKETLNDLQNDLSSALQLLEIDFHMSQNHSLSSMELISSRTEAGINNIQDCLTTQDQDLTSIKATSSRTDAGIRTIQTNLNSQSQALTLMQVTSGSAETEIKDIQNNLKVMQRANMALPNIQQQVDKTVLSTQDIPEYLKNIFETLRAVQSDVAGIMPNLTPLISQLTNQNELAVRSNMNRYDGQISKITPSEEKRSIQESVECSLEQNSSIQVLRESIDKRCTCRARIAHKELGGTYDKWGQRQSRSFTLFSLSSVFTHQRSCPMYVFSESSRSAGFRFVYRGPWFGMAMEMTVSFITRAGVYLISPSMSVSAVVPSNSPAFAAVDKLYLLRSRFLRLQHIDLLLAEIQSIFQSRAGSPYDVDQDGDTLLHRICKNQTLLSWFDDNGMYGVEDFILILQKLHSLGIPWNMTNALGMTCMNNIVLGSIYYLQYETMEVCRRLVDKGVEFQYMSPSLMHNVEVLPELLTRWPDLAEAINCNDIMLAVLRRSEVHLRKAINASSQSVNEVNSIGQTAIHLSLDWPIGIKLLLDAKAELDRADNRGFTPIMHSCERSLLDAVRLLGDAERSVNAMAALEVAMEKEVKVRASNGATERTEVTEKIVNYIIELESNRRRQLHELALSSLPPNALNDLELSGVGLLDKHAMSTVSILKKYNIAVPNALIPAWEPTTVFHAPNLTVRVANKLWMAGFKDVGVFDGNGRTPINWMSRLGFRHPYCTMPLNAELELLAWFQSKGEDLHGIEDFGASICPIEGRLIASNMHCNACVLGHKLNMETVVFASGIDYDDLGSYFLDASVEKISAVTQSITQTSSDLSNVATRVLKDILMDRNIDNCACACSIGGCSTVVMTLKERFMECAKSLQLWTVLPAIALFGFIESLEPRSSCLFSDILRFLTFHMLGLSHTCCRYRFDHEMIMKSYDEDGIQRIHDEEQVMLKKLEELLVEFENKKTELGISTSEFLIGYWRKRMREVLNELSVLKTEEEETEEEETEEEETEEEEPSGLGFMKGVLRISKRWLTMKNPEAGAENDFDAETKNENEAETENEDDDTASSDSDDTDSVYVDAE